MAATATAQSQGGGEAPSGDDAASVLPHPDDTRWWLSGQLNLIGQAHGTFTSPYQGDNSLPAGRERALSRVWTVHIGSRVTHALDLLVDVESAGGRGLGDALGVAGFTNLDVVRNPTLGSAPYLARLVLHYTVPLSATMVDAPARGILGVASRVPERRLEVRAGKQSLADVFDVNSIGSDSHLQFTNWAIDNGGAYDYAADTRGYAEAAVVEYDTPAWQVRFGEALMPTVANGLTLDRHLAKAHADNLEVDLSPRPHTVIRLLGYLNHANMGRYADALRAFTAGQTSRPDVVRTRQPGTVKPGVAANAESSAGALRLFGRLSGIAATPSRSPTRR